MIRKPLALLLVLILLFSLPCVSALAREEALPITATVSKADGAPVYDAPIMMGTPVDALAQGARVSVQQLGLSFCKITTASGEGYVPSACLSFAAMDAEHTFCVVSAKSSGKLTLRKEATTKSDSLSICPNGTVCVVLGTGKTFTYVYANGKLGYLLTQYLRFFSPAAPASATAAIINPKTYEVKTVRMRLEPKRSATEAGSFPIGQELSVIAQDDGWYEVEFNGLYGYIMQEYLEILLQADPEDIAFFTVTDAPADEALVDDAAAPADEAPADEAPADPAAGTAQ